MPTTNRCNCDGAVYEAQKNPFSVHPTCPVHGDIHAILASGRYVDRRGRAWDRCPDICSLGGGWWSSGTARPGKDQKLSDWHLTPDQMRLVIERDQHRTDCPGVRYCVTHPVPILWCSRLGGSYVVIRPRTVKPEKGIYSTISAAMDAAYKLAKESK